ncbi:hypothetical protein E2562_020233 [Oryza meyeriana var. granulata]|uniref:non-specific serine/threonine protein kinase n=1 Tax=Oryza meyeriana var. granulata TaxID=110450 RepID=A0A6G1DKT3_9ORYZ|nr:hypothetical protein E2562_020233 [Oryza meyeriana var. granulata]
MNPSLYLLAIWLDQIDAKTIVWYINGGTAVPSGSSLQLTSNGMLSLRNHTGEEIWSTQSASGAYASMNDNGNFVIYGEDGKHQWESFMAPADTILPTQELPSGKFLQARLMDTNYSNGRTNYRMSTKKRIPSQPWSRVITRVFSYKELEEATDGFNEEVGRGYSGIVYKGNLNDGFGTSIAVKKIDRIPRETEKEFTMEVETIGHTLHKNLVQLLGFCYEGTERLLVYPFMANGSLTKFLFSGMRPTWDLRVDIAHGVARGLIYLHEECGKQIINCDIKPENILLDEDFVAKISDFGLAKLLKAEQTQTSTGIRGTRGYFAPEWFKNMGISSKVDVYSFGAGDEDKVILTYWAYDCYRCGHLDLLVEDDEDAMLNMKMVERFITVALWCIQDEPAMRPTMLKVNKMLDGAIEAPQPPLNTPTFISSLL